MIDGWFSKFLHQKMKIPKKEFCLCTVIKTLTTCGICCCTTGNLWKLTIKKSHLSEQLMQQTVAMFHIVICGKYSLVSLVALHVKIPRNIIPVNRWPKSEVNFLQWISSANIEQNIRLACDVQMGLDWSQLCESRHKCQLRILIRYASVSLPKQHQ